MDAIFKKELRSYFKSPLGYVFIAVFMLVTAISFGRYNLIYQSGDVNLVFSQIILLLIVIIPVLTMRSFAEEKSKRTDQLLYTSPVKVSSIVFGKIFAAVYVFAITLVVSLIYPLILSMYTEIAWSVVISTYLGVFLMGMAFISVGVFISSLTENMLISVIATIGVLFAVYLFDGVSYLVNNRSFQIFANLISMTARYADFNSGIINIPNVIYYLSVVAIFAVLTIVNIEKRHWVK